MKKIIGHLVDKTNFFMKNMHHQSDDNLYRFCFEDKFDTKPLLASSVFASKICYTIGNLSEIKKKKLSSHIKSFEKKDGYIYDEKIIKGSFLNRKFHALRTLNFNNWYGEEIKRAETRQSFASLYLCNCKPDSPFKNIPTDKHSIKIYLDNLYWKNPWSAGSHVSHLVFFIKMNNLFFPGYINEALIEYIFEYIEKNYRKSDGSWGNKTNNSLNIKINGAMKMLNAYDLFNIEAQKINELIDLTLFACDKHHACDHLNAVYVLHVCSKFSDYRKEDIIKFMEKMLKEITSFMNDNSGGFSFYNSPMVKKYYGVKLSKKKFQSDIHGTSLFIWMIAMISKKINLKEKINLKIYLN
jgi:hypothetical protein